MKDRLYNVRISDESVLITPEELKNKYPLNSSLEEKISCFRKTVTEIVSGVDKRLLMVCGPCSIHDTKSAIDYAERLKALSDEVQDKIYIVMRVYFEKPRTTVGWKGLINDPDMDNSFNVEKGLNIARKLLINLTEIGIPLASEALDPNTPQYLGDLFSWYAIGARTTESQTHREMASGLSTPVGFKNATDGDLKVAINAIKSASMPHSFVGINQAGQVSLLKTAGNPYAHLILRGGKKPNYDEGSVKECIDIMNKAGVKPMIMIDCSHGNSNKDHTRQPLVAEDVIRQIAEGNNNIMGIMLESNICDGSQSSEQSRDDMAYGVSVTDACIGWETTAQLVKKIASGLDIISHKA